MGLNVLVLKGKKGLARAPPRDTICGMPSLQMTPGVIMGKASQLMHLKPRHQLMIRLAFEGMSNVQIAEELKCNKSAVSAVLRSQLAQAELARLYAATDEKLTDIPMRVRLKKELEEATVESVSVNRRILNNEQIDPRVRASVGRHFMDRMIFHGDTDAKEGTYRDILREIGELERALKNGHGATIINLPQGEHGPSSNAP